MHYFADFPPVDAKVGEHFSLIINLNIKLIISLIINLIIKLIINRIINLNIKLIVNLIIKLIIKLIINRIVGEFLCQSANFFGKSVDVIPTRSIPFPPVSSKSLHPMTESMFI